MLINSRGTKTYQTKKSSRNKNRQTITSIGQVHFYFLICWELYCNMTDTSQSRHKTTVNNSTTSTIKILFTIKMQQLIWYFNNNWSYKPVQPTNALLMSYSPQSRQRTPIWNYTWSHSLSLKKIRESECLKLQHFLHRKRSTKEPQK